MEAVVLPALIERMIAVGLVTREEAERVVRAGWERRLNATIVAGRFRDRNKSPRD